MTDLKKQFKCCIYNLVPYLCNAITLMMSALTIHIVGARRPLIDILSKFMLVTGPSDDSKRTKRLQGWSHQNWLGGILIIVSFYTQS